MLLGPELLSQRRNKYKKDGSLICSDRLIPLEELDPNNQ
jgi:hypothetical protein